MRRQAIPRALCLGAVTLVALAGTGCGSGRSVAAYCHAFWSRAVPLHDQYQRDSQSASRNPLTAIVDLFSAPGDLASMLDSMAAVAPEDVRSDTEATRDSLRKLQDSTAHAFENPLGAMGENLVLALGSSGSFNRVNAYLARNCPPPAGVR